MTDVDALIARHGLTRLPAEGGWFRRTWAGPESGGRPAGSAIILLLTAEADGFSGLHRLPIDEVWHFYQGDPVELLLLDPAGPGRVELLGGDDGLLQTVATARTWMGARLRPGGRWALLGTTMAPGFIPSDYDGADRETLIRQWPQHRELITALTRRDAPARMPSDVDG